MKLSKKLQIQSLVAKCKSMESVELASLPSAKEKTKTYSNVETQYDPEIPEVEETAPPLPPIQPVPSPVIEVNIEILTDFIFNSKQVKREMYVAL